MFAIFLTKYLGPTTQYDKITELMNKLWNFVKERERERSMFWSNKTINTEYIGKLIPSDSANFDVIQCFIIIATILTNIQISCRISTSIGILNVKGQQIVVHTS